MLSILWIILSTNCHVIWFIIALFLIPRVAAQGGKTPFSDIPFKLFSSFVKENFSSKITLSQVLLVLFTITDNTDLLSLHARQQNPKYPDKHASSDSGFNCGLAWALQEKLGDGQKTLFKKADCYNFLTSTPPFSHTLLLMTHIFTCDSYYDSFLLYSDSCLYFTKLWYMLCTYWYRNLVV